MSLSTNMEKIKPVIEKLNNPSDMTTFHLLQERIDYPESFVTMLGETSSGKSSILNGLLGEEYLYTAARPTSGAVVELYEYDIEPVITRYAVLKNATLRKLSKDQFDKENLAPSEDILRLRLNVPEMPFGLHGMRLFDTPGYGSIHEKHDEVLKEFIPSSDVIIYVVNYRVGIGESDVEFLTYISTYLQDDVKLFLVINRVPDHVTEDDARIKEIHRYAKDILHENIEEFMIHAIPGDGVKLPVSLELWDAVRQEIQSPIRQQKVNDVLFYYQMQLLDQAAFSWKEKLAYEQTTNVEKELFAQEIVKLRGKKQEAIVLIDQTFDKISGQLPTMFQRASEKILESIVAEIQTTEKWSSATECIGYVENHLLPRYEMLERTKIEDYLEQELMILDKKLEELINAAIVNFSRDLKLISDNFEPIVEGLMQKAAAHLTDGALKGFLKQFGGRGGAGAGVANLGKKVLKNVGNIFGKTFSRETHNKLASFLKKIGATSTRKLSIAVGVAIEGVSYLIDVHRWQGRAVKDTKKAIVTWEKETLKEVMKDIEELREVNLTLIDEVFEEYFTLLDEEEMDAKTGSVEVLTQRIAEIEQLKNDLMKVETL